MSSHLTSSDSGVQGTQAANMTSFANIGGVADPKLGHEADNMGRGSVGGTGLDVHDAAVGTGGERRRSHIYTDTQITFEDYHYWANRSREYERTIDVSNAGLQGTMKTILGRGQSKEPAAIAASSHSGSDNEKTDAAHGEGHYGVTENEWDNAQRAIRTATWGSIFYLITTDILGPYNVPWAISNMGYGPGFALYTVFGGMAAYSGWQLWKCFVGLDSTRYPLRNYGDLAFRVFGPSARMVVNILQSFQFFMNVALIIVSNGQGLAQMAQGRSGNGYICFVVAQVVFTVLGFLFGQIRTLQRLSWLSNLAIWLNVIVIIMTMVVVHEYPPNYAAAETNGIERGPVVTSAGLPPGKGLMDNINGLMNCVFAYGGATLFNELMAEMRRPMDFYKGFFLAETFIYCVYLIMGMVVYNAQGQFTYPVAFQGIPGVGGAWNWQTLGNAISFVSALIAALLYGNIGIKVVYASLLRDVFKFPPLDTKKGKLIWVAFAPIYWAAAFVVAAAIPQIANLTSFVGAACILQFSYTFPPMLQVGYNCQKDAMLETEHFDPITGVAEREDSGMKRWIRGFMKKPVKNSFDVLYATGALATAGLGLWASIIGMHNTFQDTKITPFSCQNPAG